MAIWIEFRCENRCNPSSGVNRPENDRCESHDNSGPQSLTGEAREAMLSSVRQLEGEARANGWKKTQYGWICAYCAAQPKAMQELAVEAAGQTPTIG